MEIRINGKEYPWPSVDTLTLDEAITLQRVSGKTLPQIEESLMSGDLSAIKGLMHIAVARAEPEVTFTEIERVLGIIPLLDLEQVFAGMVNAPLVSQPESSMTGSGLSSGSSGGLGSEQSQE